MSVTEIAPEAANLHDEVAKISDKLDQARRLREGLAGILALPLDATNDQIFAAVHTRRTYVPPGDRVHDQIKALQEQYARLDAQYDRLVQALRAQGSLQ
jgi:F0F1-type ATP synthase membrane subunit b/b'